VETEVSVLGLTALVSGVMVSMMWYAPPTMSTPTTTERNKCIAVVFIFVAYEIMV
jgi:hypothetical protein